MQTARHIAGVHVKHLTNIAVKAPRDIRFESPKWWTLVPNAGNIQKVIDHGTGIRNTQVEDQVQGGATKVIQLRLTHSRQDGEYEVHLDHVPGAHLARHKSLFEAAGW